MTTKAETFIVFQYSTGVGHLTRCSMLAKALSSTSHVTMFSGGKPIESYSAPSGVEFVQLPAIRWDLSPDSFPVPVDLRYTMAEIERKRSELLVESYLRTRPRVVIVEYFPFEPRRFGETLNKLFDAINKEKKRPIVLCSIRTYPRLWATDTDPTWVNEQLRKNFHGVLHHADAKLFPLTSFGPYIQRALSGVSVWQTGFIRRPLPQLDLHRPSNGLLLTVGGGSALGAKLLKRWINAAKTGSPDLLPIRAVCGPLMDVDDRKSVHAEEGQNITIYDSVSNIDELIGRSRAVVCMGGYNTLVESLSLRKPVLAFPVEKFGDQIFQVRALHAQGALLMGEQSQSEYEVAALMNQLLNFRPKQLIDFNGAERSVEIIKHLLNAQ